MVVPERGEPVRGLLRWRMSRMPEAERRGMLNRRLGALMGRGVAVTLGHRRLPSPL